MTVTGSGWTLCGIHMNRRVLHIVLLLAILLAGCAKEFAVEEVPDLQLTVLCDDSIPTKADPTKDGEQAFNENIIRSVDFLFYPGASPSPDDDAVFHIRKELSKDSMTSDNWAETFNLVVKKEVIGLIFTAENNNQATVYTLVNFDSSFISDMSATSRNDLAARRLVTDFAQNESNYVQPSFMMDGSAVVEYDEDAAINVVATIPVYRFASKLTIGVNVVGSVTLKHQDSEHNLDEVWEPVLHTMRVYLMDGIKSVLVSSHENAALPDMDTKDSDPEYFFYQAESCRRPFVREDGTSYFDMETVGGKDYLTTWPMYSYPAAWSTQKPDYSAIDYVNDALENGLPPEPPYLKLEMDWRRLAQNGYDYDRRKYYYKVYLPFNELKRNKWYGFFVDVSILGSETDEGKALLDPLCYLLDWQNKSLAINKYAVISKARYLSVDKASWDINNMETLSVPFLSSHNVMVVKESVTATRPYFGTITNSQPVGSYHKKLHAWIRQKDEYSYYLDYTGQPAGNEAWEPSNWITNTSTSIRLDHELVNDYTKDDFDYSPYTIDFDIVHTDLADDPTSITYSQYLRHITIVQRPGIYIERLHNSDTEIRQRNPKATPPCLFGYEDGEEPWADKPWGYVYVNGGRFIRSETLSHTGTQDKYFSLTTANNKREYQWQTVWYTGGSTDIYDIHATVLPSDSKFVIGDPREESVNNLDDPVLYPGLYVFTVDGKNEDAIREDQRILETIRPISLEMNPFGTYYPDRTRTGFNKARALYGDEQYRPLKWYYPTDKTTRTENMVAPSYRISSKFSGIEFGNIDMKYAEYRCAAYQEDGFPAGRWRLPTKAEVNFIGQLSAKGFFEFLFNNNGVYWSANGAIKVTGSSVVNDGSSTALLRCVYDSWYWDKIDGLEGDPRQPQRDEFVWGDKER